MEFALDFICKPEVWDFEGLLYEICNAGEDGGMKIHVQTTFEILLIKWTNKLNWIEWIMNEQTSSAITILLIY